MRVTITQKSLLFFSILVLLFSACQKDDTTNEEHYLGKKTSEYDSKVSSIWYSHTLNLIKSTSGYTPPVASRALGYIGVTFYETVRPGNLSYKTMAGQLAGLGTLPKPENGKEYYWPAAANSAFAQINTLLFPLPEAKKVLFDSIGVIKKDLQVEYRKSGISDEVLARSEKFGEDMANAIYAWSKTDVIGHESFRKNFPAGYELPVGPEKWVPTGAQLIPLQPYWGSARAFVPGSINEGTPALPIAFSTDKSSSFYEQGNEVYQTAKSLTPEQKTIALYWADGGGTITPPGHSIAIAGQLINERGEKLDRAAEVMMRMGIVVADAFICCWKTKYNYNLMRPVTYIQKNIDPTWKPLIATPPFPEYTSGHSSQSGAAAYVLATLYGKDTPFTDKTHEKRTDIDGKPRTFKNFMLFAEEAALSRLYGGIHYTMGNTEGLSSGLKIGKAHDNLKIK